jgi:hypothetical protein
MMDTSSQELFNPRSSDAARADSSDLRLAAVDLEQQLLTFVHERPVVAVFAALGLGYVVARMFSRR